MSKIVTLGLPKVELKLSATGATQTTCTKSGGSSYVLPTASVEVKGGIKIGDGLIMDGETLNLDFNFEPYTLPTASKTLKGGVKVGDGLAMTGDTLNVTLEPYELPVASASSLGGVKVGDGLSMAGDTLNVTLEPYELPVASASSLGGIKVGGGLSMAGDTLNCTVEGGYFRSAMADLQAGNYQVNLDGTTVTEICPQINAAFRNSWGRDPREGDIVNIYPPGGSGAVIYAYYTAGTWHLLGNSNLDSVPWPLINPLLSVKDRVKLDGLENYELPTASATVKGGVKVGERLKMTGDTLSAEMFTLGTTPLTVEGAMWLSID